jgi:DNA-binding NarL/FixJ family response regulator
MKIVIMDDTRQRRAQLKEAIEKQHKNVQDFYSSNDFITSIDESAPDLILLDMETWRKGKSIYNYLRLGKKLENTPIIQYNNSEEDTYFIQDRIRHEKDRVLPKPTEVGTIVELVQQNY